MSTINFAMLVNFSCSAVELSRYFIDNFNYTVAPYTVNLQFKNGLQEFHPLEGVGHDLTITKLNEIRTSEFLIEQVFDQYGITVSIELLFCFYKENHGKAIRLHDENMLFFMSDFSGDFVYQYADYGSTVILRKNNILYLHKKDTRSWQELFEEYGIAYEIKDLSAYQDVKSK